MGEAGINSVGLGVVECWASDTVMLELFSIWVWPASASGRKHSANESHISLSRSIVVFIAAREANVLSQILQGCPPLPLLRQLEVVLSAPSQFMWVLK